MVLLEAMSHGVAIVATPVGGIPEVVEDGVTGVLVEPGNPAALAKAISDLLTDPSLCARLAQAGQQRFLMDLGISVANARLHAVFTSLLEGIGGLRSLCLQRRLHFKTRLPRFRKSESMTSKKLYPLLNKTSRTS